MILKHKKVTKNLRKLLIGILGVSLRRGKVTALHTSGFRATKRLDNENWDECFLLANRRCLTKLKSSSTIHPQVLHQFTVPPQRLEDCPSWQIFPITLHSMMLTSAQLCLSSPTLHHGCLHNRHYFALNCSHCFTISVSIVTVDSSPEDHYHIIVFRELLNDLNDISLISPFSPHLQLLPW